MPEGLAQGCCQAEALFLEVSYPSFRPQGCCTLIGYRTGWKAQDIAPSEFTGNVL
jgi:hypothetical protein